MFTLAWQMPHMTIFHTGCFCWHSCLKTVGTKGFFLKDMLWKNLHTHAKNPQRKTSSVKSVAAGWKEKLQTLKSQWKMIKPMVQDKWQVCVCVHSSLILTCFAPMDSNIFSNRTLICWMLFISTQGCTRENEMKERESQVKKKSQRKIQEQMSAKKKVDDKKMKEPNSKQQRWKLQLQLQK